MATKEERKAQAIKLFQQGSSQREIAEKLQVSPATISRYLKEAKEDERHDKKEIEQKSKEQEALEAFTKDLKSLLGREADILSQLDACSQFDPEVQEQHMHNLFQAQPWLFRILATVFFEKRFQEALSKIDGNLAEKAKDVAETITWQHQWLKGEIYKYRTAQRGVINAVTGATEFHTLDTLRGYPQIEEKLFSGAKVISHIKWDLDDYAKEIDRKLERCGNCLKKFQGNNTLLDVDALNALSENIDSILQRGNNLMHMIRSLQEHQEDEKA